MRILAIDLGTSSVKLMRLDGQARVISIDRIPMPELSVEGWIKALQTNIAAHGDGRDVRGIAITGQMHGLMTRENGSTWGDGIPWHDTRSADLIPGIREAIGPDAMTTAGGPIAPGFLAASLAWVRKHDPARWARIRSVHLPKDALLFQLTGQHVTDPSDAAGTGMFAPETGDWAWSIVDALGIRRAWLPRVMPSGSIAGRLQPPYASLLGLTDGIPIIVTGGDAPVGTFGAGVTRDSDALVMLSTGAQVVLPSRAWRPDEKGRWYTWPSVAPEDSGYAAYLKVGTLLNAGNVTAWAESVLADGAMSDRPSGLVALPHIIGTREDPAQRGAILGLSARTAASDIRRALIEGVAFSVRAKLEEMSAGGAVPSRLLLGGGLAHRPDVRQLFADVLRVPVEVVAQPEVTVYGAGLLALHTLTGFLPHELEEKGEVTTPQPGSAYDAPYAIYRDLDLMMAPLTRRIVALRAGAP